MKARDITARLKAALKAYQAGVRCHCGAPIWVIGSADTGNMCFTCITGEAEPSEDYEIAEALPKIHVKKRASRQPRMSKKELEFEVEAAYGESIAASMFHDGERVIGALQRALDLNPKYAPAILTMGSIEYQRGRKAAGRKLFQSLLTLPDDTRDLCEIIDKAGDFLIDSDEHEHGLDLYRAAAKRFPAVAVFHQGISSCAGDLGLLEEALVASERAVELEPDNQKLVNDLGWSLLLGDRLEEAEKTLERAVSMDPADDLARENLRYCREQMAKRKPRN